MAHYHIRWGSGDLDWERHDTQAEAIKAAKQFARPGEIYTIEFFKDDSCQRCKGARTKAEAAH